MSPTMKVTLSDVAAKAGVSTATVSRILNGNESDQFAQDTCRKVVDAARRLQYRSGTLASQRAGKRNRVVSVVSTFALTSQQPTSFFTQTVDGVLREARRQNFQVNLVSERIGAADKIDALEQTRGLASGVLFCGQTEPEVFEFALKHQIPAVYIGDGTIPVGLVSSVQSDNWTGAKLAAQHLAGLGHRRLALVTQALHPSREYSAQRLAGFWLGLHLAGVDPAGAAIITHDDYDDLPGRLDRVFGMPGAPTGVFCETHRGALTLLQHLARRGIAVPEQVSVVGFDDFPGAADQRPALTTIHVDRDLIGQTALRALLATIADPAGPPINHVLPVSLVVRASTGPAPDNDLKPAPQAIPAKG